MFGRVLIANRGEIACRIIKTCRRLNIGTVAIYSDADRHAKHVRYADEAARVGPPNPAESYLNIDEILAVASRHGVEAIHPGYGFLSENPDFAEEVERNGITFIGPSPEAIRIMGLKDRAKSVAERAGVPVVPGYHGAGKSSQELYEEASKIGYPILLKAVAGGGGKGIRTVKHEAAFRDEFEKASKEAQLAFGNADMMIEKRIESPRHLEVQVFGDNFGNRVHLFERDCSVQRNNQKVLEEAPAPEISTEVREWLYRSATILANEIDYRGAGTVEFIADSRAGLKADSIWFLEMNTRLQVEHPVTEQITGLDLVEWQFRVAANEPMPLSQDQITRNGHAVEARICTENALEGFVPSTGQISRLKFPSGTRVDEGVDLWDTVSPYYDSLLAKMIATGETRNEALENLSRGLRNTQIDGVGSNLNLLVGIVDHQCFRSNAANTQFLVAELPISPADSDPHETVLILAAAGIVHAMLNGRKDWFIGFGLYGVMERKLKLNRCDQAFELDVSVQDCDTFVINTAAGHSTCRIQSEGLLVDGVNVENHIYVRDSRVTVYCESVWEFSLAQHFHAEKDRSQLDSVLSPVPGLLRLLEAAQEGRRVVRGDVIAKVEAMKMEFAIEAPTNGVIGEMFVEDGGQVDAGTRIARIEIENSIGRRS